MKKKIVIESSDNPISNRRTRLLNNKFFEWVLYIICYALVLIIVSVIFNNSFYLNNNYYGLYALLASIIIYILNQTVKPFLFYITLPLTAITFGLFYPIINVIILYLTSFLLGDNLQIHGFILPFIIAILISLLNLLLEGMIIRPIINKGK